MAAAAGLAASIICAHAQDVTVTGTLTDVPGAGNVYDYTLTLENTGSEAVQSLWMGWIFGDFDVASPSSPANSAGWTSTLDGNSIKFAGTPGSSIQPGQSATFEFDSTSTPAQFESGTAGPSVAYGTNATQFAFEDTTLNSREFTPTLTATPEPSTLSLLVVGSIGIVAARWRKTRGS